jgi:hypothetical protein
VGQIAPAEPSPDLFINEPARLDLDHPRAVVGTDVGLSVGIFLAHAVAAYRAE